MDLQELITSLQGEESPDVTLKLGLTIIFSGGDKDLSEKTIERAKMLNPDYKPICDKISGILTSLGPLSPNQSKKAIDQVLKASNSEELMMEMEMVIRGEA
ncbi:MAG: hypothetical protein NTX42_00735 [Methanothrix sp.]|nr:hypothetical protein [Methanothrix sp.]